MDQYSQDRRLDSIRQQQERERVEREQAERKAEHDAYMAKYRRDIDYRVKRAKSEALAHLRQEPKSPVSEFTARERWTLAVAEAKASGLPNAKAVTKVNRENPGLRQRMLEEINGKK